MGTDCYTRLKNVVGQQYFLASKYIRNSEVPRLLSQRQTSGLPILPLVVRPCAYDLAEFRFPDPQAGPNSLRLNEIQSANPENVPLSSLPEAQQDEVFSKLARRLYSLSKGAV
jgi:hypothetical protein